MSDDHRPVWKKRPLKDVEICSRKQRDAFDGVVGDKIDNMSTPHIRAYINRIKNNLEENIWENETTHKPEIVTPKIQLRIVKYIDYLELKITEREINKFREMNNL